MNWLDSHCHLNDEAYKQDLDLVLNRMLENNVTRAIIISSFIDDYYYALSINKEGIEFKRSLGIYPGDVDNVNEEILNKYFEVMKQEECVAIGEIGLDYHYSKENKEKQKEIFEKQCIFAKKIDKPVIIHSREAIQDTYDILKRTGVRGVIHCYSDSKEMAKELVKLGFYISISGTCTFKNAKEPLEVIKAIPKDKLLIETDSPYLTPTPHRGERNEPSFVVYTGKRICEELGIDEEEFKAIINQNYDALLV